jgi:hypothetical protein
MGETALSGGKFLFRDFRTKPQTKQNRAIWRGHEL